MVSLRSSLITPSSRWRADETSFRSSFSERVVSVSVSGSGQRRCPDLSLPLLVIVWYGCSAITSLTTKEILKVFPHPITVSTVQQSLAAVFGWIYATSGGSTSMPGHSLERSLPLASVVVAMVGALVSYRWSLLTVSVSFTHTIKTLGPLFTMVWSLILLGERTPITRALSVLPVVCGVAITTVTEVEFAIAGLLAALVSTGTQALQMVLVKRLLSREDIKIGKSELFYKVALYSLLLLVPLFIVHDARPLHRNGWRGASAATHWLLVNGVCSFANQYITISVLDKMVSPLSHALANVMKRAAIITVAMLYAGREVSALHVCGVALSVFGSFTYQQASNCIPASEPPPSIAEMPSECAMLLPMDDAGQPLREGQTPSQRSIGSDAEAAPAMGAAAECQTGPAHAARV